MKEVSKENSKLKQNEIINKTQYKVF